MTLTQYRSIWPIGEARPLSKDSQQWNFYGDSTMEIQQDFKELLALLNEHKVKYLIVGGYALAFHGAPRYTGDLDILIKVDKKNAEHILAALADFGFGQMNITADDFEEPEMVIQLGLPPVRVDIMTSLTGIDWDHAYAGKVPGDYGGVPTDYIGLEQFIANKRAVGRKRDQADIEALGQQ